MPTYNFEVLKEVKRAELDSMQHFKYKIAVNDSHESEKVPMLNNFLINVSHSSEALLKLGKNTPVFHGLENVQHGFHFGGAAIAALDFVRIPFIYLVTYLLKEKVPINLNNNARWLYSAVLLGLTITSLIIPAVAPFIAIASASLGFLAGSFLLGKFLYQRYKFNQHKKNTEKQLDLNLEEMDKIQLEVAELSKQLSSMTSDNAEQYQSLYNKIDVLKTRFTKHKERIEHLINEVETIQAKSEKYNYDMLIKRTIAVVLAAGGVVGVVLSIIIPPVGLAILTGVAIATGIFVGTKIALIAFTAIKSLVRKPEQKTDAIANPPVVDVSPAVQEDITDEKACIHESTANVYDILSHNPPVSHPKPTKSIAKPVSETLVRKPLHVHPASTKPEKPRVDCSGVEDGDESSETEPHPN